jgi:hypothetical protein
MWRLIGLVLVKDGNCGPGRGGGKNEGDFEEWQHKNSSWYKVVALYIGGGIVSHRKLGD